MAENSVAQIAEWIASLSDVPIEVGPDTDIIEQRLVTSLQLIQLIIRIETMTGRQIDIDNVDVDNFRTVRRIGTHFFGHEPAAKESVS